MTKEQLMNGWRTIGDMGGLKDNILKAIEQAYDIGFYEGQKNGLKVANQITDMINDSFKKL